ncbi:ABC transporter permease [Jiangella alba]|uniref:Transport permease protein n=1 Tax=Jiangella alba TaxID=561176 RepID=A0A1H5PSS8_9ACTN|nr:ABC transporter permease [Jiangella alba]SEF16057.1 ABC transporter efflux protein, DrrB family [Jiangella alba]
MSSLVHGSLVLAGRTFGHWRAQPVPFLVTLLFPVLIVLMMGGLFGGAIAGSAGDYVPFVVPGVLALTMLFGLETTMIAIATDASRGVTDRFRSLPLHSGSVVAGRCLADLAASVAGLAAMTLAGFALGWRWSAGPGEVLAAYGLLLLLRFGLLWVGVWAGLKAPGPEAVAAVQIMVWPVAFLSTVFLDPATMPSWLGAVAEWNPLSATADAVRELFGNPGVAGGSWPADHGQELSVMWPILMVAVFAPLSAAAYRRSNR